MREPAASQKTIGMTMTKMCRQNIEPQYKSPRNAISEQALLPGPKQNQRPYQNHHDVIQSHQLQQTCDDPDSNGPS